MNIESTINVLIACEESQAVCKAFRARGFNAYSCDIIPESGGCPHWHIQGDALDIINGDCFFKTNDNLLHYIYKWDLIIAHPPCTYLTVSGNRWFNIEKYGDKAKERYELRAKAADFFMEFIHANCNYIAVENPIGAMSVFYRKPTQIIQPYEYGNPVKKSTCLWLKNLPSLVPTNIVEYSYKESAGKKYSGAAYYATDENGKALRYNDPETKKQRSKTFPGIAAAMAEQWGNYLLENL